MQRGANGVRVVLLLLRQFLAEPRHRSIEMMELQRLGAGDPVVLAPAVGRQVGAAAHQPVQHAEEDRPLQREPVLALLGHVLDHRPAAGLGPQALEHQGRPDPPDRRGRVVLRRAQHHRLGREPRARAHQPLQLTARREHVQTPEGGDHPLADLAPDPLALRDLEIGPPARGLLAEIHRRSHVGAYNITIKTAEINNNLPYTWHYVLLSDHSLPQEIRGFQPPSPTPTVEDGSSAMHTL